MEEQKKEGENVSFLEVREVGKSYRSRKGEQMAAVCEACFSLEKGRCLGIVGESGCGKSTLCRMIAGIEKPDTGEIRYRGEKADYKRDRQKIQMVFQNSMDAVNLHLNAEKIISEPLENFFSLSREERRRETGRLMELTGLSPEDIGKYPNQFSGGQLQRICIARALAAKPELLILDEPLSSLDVSVQAQLLNLLEDLKRRLELTCILISHDLEAVFYLADELAVMYGGSLVETLSDIENINCLRHPYTERLLSVCCKHGENALERAAYVQNYKNIKDNVEMIKTGKDKGCAYAERCSKADRICFCEKPKLLKREPGHQIACHHDHLINFDLF